MSAVSRLHRLLQFDLRMLLMLVALCAVLVAWHQDRQRLNNLRNAVQALRAAATPLPASGGFATSVGSLWPLATFSPVSEVQIETVDDFVAAIQKPPGEPASIDTILGLQIGQVHADEAVPQIIDLLNDKDENVRNRAVRALGRIARRSHIAVPALIQALHDESSEVSAQATHALSQFGKRAAPAVADLMTIANDDTTSNCALAVYSILRVYPDTGIAINRGFDEGSCIPSHFTYGVPGHAIQNVSS